MQRSHDLNAGVKERYIIIDRQEQSVSFMDTRQLPAQFRGRIEKEAKAAAQDIEVPA